MLELNQKVINRIVLCALRFMLVVQIIPLSIVLHVEDKLLVNLLVQVGGNSVLVALNDTMVLIVMDITLETRQTL